jgi:two-component sensor histidine kinase
VSVAKYHPNTREFLVETPPSDVPDHLETSLAMLRSRVQQQQILADFGVLALKGTPLSELLDQAARSAAEGLGAEFAKVLKYLPEESRFLVCSGVGWGSDVVGKATIGADTASPAGYALQTGKSVISNHLDIEERFRTPQLLVEYGIRRAMNVILGGDGIPFGVLEVDSRSEGEFREADLVFLRGIANILGMAIERHRVEESLRKALDRQKTLMKEVNHRVNNSFQIIASMLVLHSSASQSADVRHELRQASSRIAAVARVHRRLYSGDEIDSLDLGAYLHDVCTDLAGSLFGCEINVNAEKGVVVRTDRAIPAVLAVNELITNAAKYAYVGRPGSVWVTMSLDAQNAVTISVRDKGVGLPSQVDNKSGGLGMRLVNAFAQQLLGELRILRRDQGTEFVLSFPLFT